MVEGGPTFVSEMVDLGGGVEFCIHQWNRELTDPEAIIVIYHGFLAHGLYPTVRYAAELLVSASPSSWKVISADFRGHGRTPEGLRGYLPDRTVLVQDAKNIAEYAMASSSNKDKEGRRRPKLFLLGSSMGGALALQVAQTFAPYDQIAGVILLAPMLKLEVDPWKQVLLSGLAWIIPTWKIIPSSSTDPGLQYRDESKRKECELDPYQKSTTTTTNQEHDDNNHDNNSKSIHVGSAWTCVSLAEHTATLFPHVQVAFFLAVAEEDVVVNNQGSFDLYQQSPSSDKTLQKYPALHGLLCEPSPLFDTIAKDITDWIRKRC